MTGSEAHNEVIVIVISIRNTSQIRPVTALQTRKVDAGQAAYSRESLMQCAGRRSTASIRQGKAERRRRYS